MATRTRLRATVPRGPRMDRVEDRPRVPQLDPRADAVAAAGPARVDEPGAGAVPLHLLGELRGVLHRVPHEEDAFFCFFVFFVVLCFLKEEGEKKVSFFFFVVVLLLLLLSRALS